MRIPPLNLEGKVAVITGARRGIGAGCALVLAEAGADIAICDWVTKTGELRDVARQVRALGRKVIARNVDIKNSPQVNRFVKEVTEKFGRIDILVNNAGVTDAGRSGEKGDFDPKTYVQGIEKRTQQLRESASILFQDEKAWDAVLKNNVIGLITFCKAVAPVMMKQQSGSIVNIASIRASAIGFDAMQNYAVSKRAMVMITEGLAADLSKYRIRVNAIGPGGTRTMMMRAFTDFPERLKEYNKRMYLTGRLIEPEEIAHGVLFFASDLARNITGQFIMIECGQRTHVFHL